jgi:transcriptional regulator with XRE-family HTH domain
MAEESLGGRLRRRRWGELRAAQRDVAAAAGISPAQLCEVERGTAGTTAATLTRLAAVLGLDADALLAHAAREGRLYPYRGRIVGDAPPPPPLPPPRRPAPGPVPPGREWLELAEAAAVLRCSTEAVRRLVTLGTLAPARREPKGGGRQRRWLVAATAVAAYDPGNARRVRPNPQPDPPPGHLSIGDAVAASGLSRGAFYRRMAALGLATVRDGHRRWVPIGHLEALRAAEADEAE